MPFDARIGGFEFDIDCEGVITGGGPDFKLTQESSFPGWATKAFRSKRRPFGGVLHICRRISVIVVIVIYF